jgi:peptidoglycan/xylan/chitin deacetylase (PgdA/CDA1 family)
VTDELAPLARALDQVERPVTFWWRDDDAGRSDPRLRHLLSMAERLEAPVALAVVPAWLEPAVVAEIAQSRQATVLQHGWAHANHAAEGERKIELGGTAPRGHLAALLAGGARVLAAAFAERFAQVMVPPWNRMSQDVAAMLPGLGYRAASAMASAAHAPGEPPRIDVHVDVMDWRGRRSFKGVTPVAAEVAARMRDSQGPIGIMTHHLVMDATGFEELERLLALLRRHPGARLRPVADLLGEA